MLSSRRCDFCLLSYTLLTSPAPAGWAEGTTRGTLKLLAQELTCVFFRLDLPPVKPSAIALGTFFNHGIELAILGPVFGQTYQRAKQANTKEEFIKSKEASGAAIAWGTSFVGSALQSYGVGALINATATLSYKGAAYLGGLIFAATAAPGVSFFSFSSPFPSSTVIWSREPLLASIPSHFVGQTIYALV